LRHFFHGGFQLLPGHIHGDAGRVMPASPSQGKAAFSFSDSCFFQVGMRHTIAADFQKFWKIFFK